MSKKKLNVLMLAVCKPEAIGGQAACARMLLNHFKDVNWKWISFPLPMQYNAFMRTVSSIGILLKALWICITNKIDVVHLLTACGRAALFEKLIIARILKFTGVKTVINFQGAFDQYYAGFSDHDRKWIQNLLKKVDVVLCLHSDIEKFLFKEKLVRAGQTFVISNAVEVEPLPEHSPDPDNKIRMLYLGWLVQNKGLFTLVEAVGILKNKYNENNFTLDIIGPEVDNGIITSLKSLATKNGTDSIIRFLEPVFGSEKRDCFASADLFIFPTRMEGFPFVLLEAMEAGMSVVTTDISPLNLIVENGKTGILFKRDNADDLAEKISGIMHDQAARSKLGENARALIIQKYSVEKIISQYSLLYNQLSEHID